MISNWQEALLTCVDGIELLEKALYSVLKRKKIKRVQCTFHGRQLPVTFFGILTNTSQVRFQIYSVVCDYLYLQIPSLVIPRFVLNKRRDILMSVRSRQKRSQDI